MTLKEYIEKLERLSRKNEGWIGLQVTDAYGNAPQEPVVIDEPDAGDGPALMLAIEFGA